MSHGYVTVQWTKRKIVYDAVVAVSVLVYLGLFIGVGRAARPDVSDPILMMRAFGSCAFVMLTLILCIGPLARLDTRFAPLLYNRRHFGVLMCLVAIAHARSVLGFYQAYSDVPGPVALLSFDVGVTATSWPFPLFGVGALAIVVLMAVTSHDFWQKTLGGALWKTLHMGVYVAFFLSVLHVVFGALQLETHPVYVALVGGSALLVGALHVVSALRSTRLERAAPGDEALVDYGGERWIDAGPAAAVPKNRALPVVNPRGERIALVRNGDRLSAIHGVCAHQGGPLSEGKVIDGCLTCPWHGWQYRAEDGCSPPPFTEKVPTYRIALDGERVLIDPNPLADGTPVEPILVPGTELAEEGADA